MIAVLTSIRIVNFFKNNDVVHE